jgi:hypothetical protein
VSGKAFYDDVADALAAFLPPKLRDFGSYRSSYNIKVWYGDETREHYEAQYMKHNRKIVLEIGFHTEHKDRSRNDEVLERLVSEEKKWRKDLGRAPEAGPFIGPQSGSWRRISELWEGQIGGDAAVDAAERLATYIRILEPLRNKSAAKKSRAARV